MTRMTHGCEWGCVGSDARRHWQDCLPADWKDNSIKLYIVSFQFCLEFDPVQERFLNIVLKNLPELLITNFFLLQVVEGRFSLFFAYSCCWIFPGEKRASSVVTRPPFWTPLLNKTRSNKMTSKENPTRRRRRRQYPMSRSSAESLPSNFWQWNPPTVIHLVRQRKTPS